MAGKLIGKVAMTAAERQRRWRVWVRKTKAVERIAAKHRAKQRHRVAREAEFAGATVAAAQALEALGRRAYGVLYIDPPWRPCSFPNKVAIINARAPKVPGGRAWDRRHHQGSILPKAIEASGAHLRVTPGIVQLTVAEISRQGPRVDAVVDQLKAGLVA